MKSSKNTALRCGAVAMAVRGIAALLLMLSCVGGAAAQQILMLQTRESNASYHSIMNNAAAEFSGGGTALTRIPASQAAGNTGLETANKISEATFQAPGGGRYDIVVVVSAGAKIHETNWNVIRQGIEQRWANTFVLFIDGCCGRHVDNIPQLLTTLNGAMGLSGATAMTAGTSTNSYQHFWLNTDSPYHGSFTGLNPFGGGHITYINQVPAANALYLKGTNTSAGPPTAPPGGATGDDVFSVLVPVGQSHNGSGACLFSVVDSSMFDGRSGLPYTSSWNNIGNIRPAFIRAATEQGGACGIPASVSKSFADASLQLGGQTVLTIQLNNLSAGSSAHTVSDANVIDVLPAPLRIAGPATHDCMGGTLSAPVGGDTVSLTGATIPQATLASTGCSISVPVQWPDDEAGFALCDRSEVENVITPPLGFNTSLGQVNAPARAALSCIPPELRLYKSTSDVAGGPFAFSLTNASQATGQATTEAADTAVQVDGDDAAGGVQPYRIRAAATAIELQELATPGWKLQEASCVHTGSNTQVGSWDAVAGKYVIPAAEVDRSSQFDCSFRNRRHLVDLSVSKSDGVDVVVAGDMTHYLITVANAGPDEADGTVLVDDWLQGQGVDCASASGGALVCESASGGAACPAGLSPETLQAGLALAPFPPGASLQLKLSCKVLPAP